MQRASRLVPIVVLLDYLGIANPGTPEGGVSIKVFCPFQDTHPQERAGEKDMRIYSDGKAFCHMCAEGWDSVSLAARIWDLSMTLAAQRLLAMQGIDVSDEDVVLNDLLRRTPEQLRADAVAALGVWADANEVDRFSPSYARCLELADQIVTGDHVNEWLTACKAFLSGELNAERNVHRGTQV